jgi:hypothetical protein
MRNFKNYGLLIGILFAMLTSCLGDYDYTVDEWAMKNAQIASFTLSNDSIAGLSAVVFTIDQINGKIFNRDSMPFGTVIDEKVLCDMTFDGYAIGVIVMPMATGDTISVTDSIDFSQPVIFKVYAADAETTKSYEAQINIHQVNPDSMVWDRYSTLANGRVFEEMKTVEFADSYSVFARENGNVTLFTSSGLEIWTEITLHGFPDNAILSSITEYDGKLFVTDRTGKLYLTEDQAQWNEASGDDSPAVKGIMGKIRDNTVHHTSALCCIAEVDDILRFCTYNPEKGWTVGGEVPQDFPVTGFGNITYDIMYFPHLIIASGRDRDGNLTDKAWDTMDGLKWVSLTNEKNPFARSEGASLARYDNLLFLMGGFGEDENAIVESYFSKDNGVTWNDTIFFPEDYKSRGYLNVTVDSDKYMLLFGGKETKDGNIVNEIWRGRINRFGFRQD